MDDWGFQSRNLFTWVGWWNIVYPLYWEYVALDLNQVRRPRGIDQWLILFWGKSKHCQRQNGPEGWVLLTKVTRSFINLYQISKFKISTEHQHFDQTLTSKPWPNIHFITSPSLSSKILTKLQFQNFAYTSTSNSCAQSRKKLKLYDQTSASKSA